MSNWRIHMLALIDIIDYTLGSLNEYTRSSIHKIANMLIEDGIATQKTKKINYLLAIFHALKV